MKNKKEELLTDEEVKNIKESEVVVDLAKIGSEDKIKIDDVIRASFGIKTIYVSNGYAVRLSLISYKDTKMHYLSVGSQPREDRLAIRRVDPADAERIAVEVLGTNIIRVPDKLRDLKNTADSYHFIKLLR